MIYKTKVGNKEIEYGALVENSRFTEDEWSAIYEEVVKVNQPEVFEKKKDDADFINAFGALIALEERYEALLGLLPQNDFSYAGTHPKWVADAVELNTLNKLTTMYDVSDMLDSCETLEELKEELSSYFELGEL